MFSLLDDLLRQPIKSARLMVIIEITNAPVGQYGLFLDRGAPRALVVDRSLVHGL